MAKLTKAQRQALEKLAANITPLAALTNRNRTMAALVTAGYAKERWIMGGVIWVITPAGKALLLWNETACPLWCPCSNANIPIEHGSDGCAATRKQYAEYIPMNQEQSS